MKRGLIALGLLLVTLPLGAARAATNVPCSGPSGVSALPAVANAGTGGYAVPANDPTALVAFAHGYGNESASWNQHMIDAASHGALAFTPDYDEAHTPNRGWQVTSGAKDLIGGAQFFLDNCPSIQTVFLFGVSMGGNTSGLALIDDNAMRSDGSPLWNYWFDIEGVTNMTETYLEASALAPSNAYAAKAQADIEAETGGTLADSPQAYLDRTVVAHPDVLATNGVNGVVIVHGADDGLVPHNQSREIAAELRAAGIPTDFTTVLRQDGKHDNDTTLTGSVLPAPYVSPFDGHGWEGSNSQRVITLAHDKLHDLLDQVAAGDSSPGISDHEIIDDAAGSFGV